MTIAYMGMSGQVLALEMKTWLRNWHQLAGTNPLNVMYITFSMHASSKLCGRSSYSHMPCLIGTAVRSSQYTPTLRAVKANSQCNMKRSFLLYVWFEVATKYLKSYAHVQFRSREYDWL